MRGSALAGAGAPVAAVGLGDQLGNILREAAVSFLAVDNGGDTELDYDEFTQVLSPLGPRGRLSRVDGP